ncbi:MAG: preprotein translocase subunit YajC [Sphingomonadales bacterium]|nr:preprotein translocase subunit YajC [Sphingomonadales bacterium]
MIRIRCPLVPALLSGAVLAALPAMQAQAATAAAPTVAIGVMSGTGGDPAPASDPTLNDEDGQSAPSAADGSPALPADFGAGGQGDGLDHAAAGGSRHSHIAPYIEAQQVIDAEVSPQSDIANYTALTAGVDASITGRNNQGTLSLLYQRQIGEGGGAASADIFSGLGRVSLGVVPDTLRIDAAGYATSTEVLGNGAAIPDITTGNAGLTQIYGAVVGPTLTTGTGDLHLDAHYHLGYDYVGTPGGFTAENGPAIGTIREDDTVQDAGARLSSHPGDLAPVGLALEGGWYAEDISVLAQRITDEHVRAETTIPVAGHVALVGGIGYEHVEVSSRNAVLDAQGNPVYATDGSIVTDNTGPRYIAFDTSGLIWDVGVLWRPSSRTSLEAHVGRRYGDIGGYGLFSWRPSSRQALNIAVYNNMAGFGGELDSSLIDLSTQFQTVRNALTGNISPCVGSATGGTCLTGMLGALRSTVFRSRGVSASYTLDLGRIQAGIGAGYDRRQYIGAAGTVLAIDNGAVDQNSWVTGFVTYALDRRSSLSGTLDAYWFRTGLALGGDLNAVGATAVYERRIGRNLSGSAAIGIDAINQQALAEVWSTSGELGVRYTF